MLTSSLRHTYASLAEFNDTLSASGSSVYAADTANNGRKLRILEEVSRLIDARARRGSGFGPWVGTKRYDGDGRTELYLNADLSALTTLSIASSQTATPETPTVDDDFYLAGLGSYDPPYRRIILHGDGTPARFGCGYRTTSVTGTWTYPYRTLVLTPTTAEAVDETETVVDVSALTGLSPGMTILVDSEQMYVTGTTDDTTDSLTVERGVNGTTAATHLTSAAITRYIYDSSVHTLCARLAEKRWKSRDAGADGIDGGGDLGSVSMREGEDTIIRRMLGPIRLMGVV